MLKNVDDSYKDVKSVKYKTMTSDNVNMQMNGERIKRQFTQILERQVYLAINGEVADFKPNNTESDKIKVQELTSEDLKDIFQSKDTCSRLFPGERILPGWHPYRLLSENIPQMMDEFTFWGTKSSNLSTYTTLTVTENYSLGKMSVYKIICVYGSDGIDIRVHVLKHIHNVNILLKSGAYTSIMIDVSHPLNCQGTGTFLSVFEKCGLKINEDLVVNKMVLLEREMK
ncbi:hypothetical protein SNE40_009017 [Patella caerulea]|uniref:Histidine N-acetyltransferase C-terminal domain-containing protein n=1 Tax=Patella caerulea TaxID=87958 RepID=A0AAN8JVK6_PATCE